MNNDFELTLKRLQTIVAFYKRNHGALGDEFKRDVEKLTDIAVDTLEEPVDYLNDQMKVLRSWEGAI